MISWIQGELINSWHENQKNFVLLNCQGIGYEIQISNPFKKNTNDNTVTLWVHHIKREDSEALFGFTLKEDRDFYRDLILIKGIGPQIGMSILNNFSMDEIIKSVAENDKSLLSSIPGIGRKMTDRILFELRNKFSINKYDSKRKVNMTALKTTNNKLNTLLEELEFALIALEYPKKEIKNTIQIILSEKGINSSKEYLQELPTFEELIKQAIRLLDTI